MTEVDTPRGNGLARLLHPLFKASLIVKGALAASEGLAGLGLLVTNNARILAFVDWLTRAEIVQDPQDKMALAARHLTEGLSIQSQHFYALYLCAHGGLKLVMVLLLSRGVRWAYPAAMALLAGFVLYQMEHWMQTRAAPLLILSAFDTMMIGLVWREWRTAPPPCEAAGLRL